MRARGVNGQIYLARSKRWRFWMSKILWMERLVMGILGEGRRGQLGTKVVVSNCVFYCMLLFSLSIIMSTLVSIIFIGIFSQVTKQTFVSTVLL